ncbi:MAG: helix-turn-helix transcriptional regulator [Acidimicrobiales bacterium]
MEQRIDPIVAVTALSEPLRRRIYEHVAAIGEVSRDGAAAALGVARSVAAFHLDKLVEAGLLETDFRRPPGRGGPGAGRPAKWYRRAEGELSVSVPERRYQLAATLLGRAMARAVTGGLDVDEALRRVARDEGRKLAREIREERQGRPAGVAPAPTCQLLMGLLGRHGYEPQQAGGRITLVNCPFRALAEEQPELVCAMNLDLLRAVAEEVGLPSGAARLDPAAGRCCVTIAA